MNWDAIGALSEVVGAIGILITLIYLAIQIRQNTKIVQTEYIQRLTDSFNQVNFLIASDDRMAQIMRKGRTNYEGLEDVEKARFNFMNLAIFRIYDSLFSQMQRGTGEKELWDAELKTLKWIFSAPGARSWWREHPFTFSQGFSEFIDKNIIEPIETDA